MGYSEFVEWVAYLGTEPLGDARSDVQTAMICTTLASANRRKGAKKVKLESFLPDYWHDKSRPENLMRTFRGIEQEATADAARNPRRRADRQDRRLQEEP